MIRQFTVRLAIVFMVSGATTSILGLPLSHAALVAHWPLNEGSGDVFQDVIGGINGFLPEADFGEVADVEWDQGPPTQPNAVRFLGENSFIATEFPVPEVCVYFGSRLLRGCRTTKASTSNFDAFDSPNEPPLGLVGTHIQVFARRIRQRPPADRTQKALAVRDIRPAKLATFRLFPGVTPDVLDNVLQTPLQGLVLESYGAGNGPSNDRAFLSTLRSAVERGVTIVNLSQCQHGGVSQNDYATGRALTDVGVISGGDMTVEAAITKMMFLFSQNLSVDQVKRQMAKNLVGELSEPLTTS